MGQRLRSEAAWNQARRAATASPRPDMLRAAMSQRAEAAFEAGP